MADFLTVALALAMSPIVLFLAAVAMLVGFGVSLVLFDRSLRRAS